MTDGDVLLYFCGSSVLVFTVGSIVLCFFWNDLISRFVGFLALKPIIAYWTSFIIWWYLYHWLYPHPNVRYVIHFVIETCLLLAIYYWSRDLYKDFHRLLRLFVGFDLFRWGSVLILFSDFGPFSNYGDIAYFILFVFPIAAAVFALIYAVNRRQKSQTFQGI